MPSFSEQVVTAGVPVVLGWALPVGDHAASQAAASLYGCLAKGFDVAKAIAYTRQQLLENGSPFWHLLRAYVDDSKLNAIVSKGRIRTRSHNTSQKFLDAGNRIAVCSRTEFVGRRRVLQNCLSALRAYNGNEFYHEGVLLSGMGGLGKSSTASRLVDRLNKSHKAVICYGRLDTTTLLSALNNAELTPQQKQNTQTLLNDANLSLKDRLSALFNPDDSNYSDLPLLIVLDDFEQNIPEAQRKLGQHIYDASAMEVLNSLLLAIRESQSDVRVIVTSRYDVPVAAPCALYSATPSSLSQADQDKKLTHLPHLQITRLMTDEEKAVKQRAIELGAGNPRLLEWLNEVLAETAIDNQALFKQLEDKEADFREAVLIQELVNAQSEAVRHSLACAALYHLPMNIAAIEAIADTDKYGEHLAVAAKAGLVEVSQVHDEKHYFVSNLLNSSLDRVLSNDKKAVLSAQASEYLYDLESRSKDEEFTLEIIRLAVDGRQTEIAVELADSLTTRMLNQNRYREAEILSQQVLALGEDFRLLTALARAEHSLGKETCREHYDRAVSIMIVL